MTYVLTIIHPPVSGAAFGRAKTYPPAPSHAFAVEHAVRPLMDAGLTYREAAYFAAEVWDGQTCGSAEIHHEGTGLTFRIDPITNAPHSCPCCGRLVVPGAHAFADMEDSLCDGCYTWDRGVEPCLPANTAHPAEEG